MFDIVFCLRFKEKSRAMSKCSYLQNQQMDN